MSRTSRSLRILGAWCVALLLYSALPHLHAPESGQARSFELAFARDAQSTAATPELSADDRHESHSSTHPGDEHPCALCRSPQGRMHAALAPPPADFDVADRRLAARPDEIARAEQLFARRHPARAPPVA
jgi:hypothetical protein